MDPQKIARINELYRRSKAEGLTDAEKKEPEASAAWNISRPSCMKPAPDS